ncbi:hypothetical protein TCSYLVIO_007413 [Trypanosoma cruzi]|nr:hypothetical protein TCSYLVIO_007413 [Trypanosoma cruzi]
MYKFGGEAKDLRNIYNFGDMSQRETEPPKDLSLAENKAYLVDVEVHSDNNEEEMGNRESQQPNSRVSPTAHGVPQSSAFFPEFSHSSGPDVPRKPSMESTSDQKNSKEKQKENSKVKIAKEVLGINKKNTSGMSPEEKERVLLEERWKRAMAEENRLNALEEQVTHREQATNSSGLLPNFPPKFLCIKPLVHHDISSVPEVRRHFVRFNFINWIATCVLLLVNMIIVIAVVFASHKEDAKKFHTSQNTVLAILYLMGAPLSFIVWYWQIYSACSTGRHTKHLLALSGLVIALAFDIFMIVGRTNYAACGVSLAIDISKTKSKLAVLPVIVVLFFWVVEAVILCYCIAKQWMYYRLDVNAQEEVRRQMRNVIGI